MTVIDIAIIGGGVSGTYSAWRLKQKYPEKNIVLFEYSNRIGGRLLTVKFDGIDINGELGGMRYIPKQHKLFHDLVEKLGLRSQPFMMGPDWDKSGDENLFYFRGARYRIKEINKIANDEDFHFNWAEKGKTPDEIQKYVLDTLIPNHQNISDPKEMAESKIFEKELWQYGFWNLLYRVLSPEAYSFLKYGSGYDTNVSNGNAAILLPTGSEYSPEDDKEGSKFMTLEAGLQSLPLTLAKEFKTAYQGEIKMNQRLHSIKRIENGNYNLEIHPTITDEDTGETKDHLNSKIENFEATHVILAMPRRSLELIEWDQWIKNKELKKNLKSVLNQDAMKIFLAYDYAWWKSLDLHKGRSITDLPIRQTLYFGSPKDDKKGITLKEKALLMASYNDIETIPFWKGLAHTDSSDELFPGPKGHQATKAMVKEAREQVEELHNQQELPKPIAAAYADWSKDPFGAGWHCWKPNVRYWEIMEKMRHPVEDENVYICGDAYSNDQGWAEGALETAELMLRENFDIKKHETGIEKMSVSEEGIEELEEFAKDWEIDLMKRRKY